VCFHLLHVHLMRYNMRRRVSQASRGRSLMSASLRRRRDAHTVLVRMARDEARAGRVRELKGRFPEGDPSWAEIAAYVGVAERSALAWQQTGEISRSNAIKLARFFIERGVRIGEDYIWDGPKPDTPDLLTVLNG